MLWPFSRFRNPDAPSRGTIEAIYGMIVAQAREPVFYAKLDVPDTVNGRVDMIILHIWLVLRRLRTVEGGAALSQALFDHLCNDVDGNLREMGVGDLTVPKRMQAFGEAFYGRSTAYDLAIENGTEALAQSLSRNVLNGGFPVSAERLARYVIAAAKQLDAATPATMMTGAWAFPNSETA